MFPRKEEEADESQLDRPIPKISEPACYGRKRERRSRTYLSWPEKSERRNTHHQRRGNRTSAGLCPDQAAWSKRCRNSGSLARPNIERLTNFSFWTSASTGPLL